MALAEMAGGGLDGSSATASLMHQAPVPAELVQATVRAAVQVAAGQATSQVVSGVVAFLVQRVLWSMTMIKISGVVAGVVLVGMAGYGVGTAAQKAGQPQSVQRVGRVENNARRQDGQPTADPTPGQQDGSDQRQKARHEQGSTQGFRLDSHRRRWRGDHHLHGLAIQAREERGSHLRAGLVTISRPVTSSDRHGRDLRWPVD